MAKATFLFNTCSFNLFSFFVICSRIEQHSMYAIDEMTEYFKQIETLINKFEEKYDCIVAIKRSGWIMGVLISNKFDIPLFDCSEISILPDKFQNVLLVDDKICSGKTMRKYFNNLVKKGKTITTAAIYIEEDVFTDYWLEHLGKTRYMWYETQMVKQ